MAGERQFLAGSEDPHPVVGPIRSGRQQEGGLGQIGPTRERGQIAIGEPVGVDDDRERVARNRQSASLIGVGSENVELLEPPLHDSGSIRNR